MSFRRPSSLKKKAARSSRSPVKSDLVPVDNAPKIRRPYGTGDMPIGHQGLLYAPGGPYTQPMDPGQDMRRSDNETAFGPLAEGDGYNEGFAEREHPSKKVKQWKRWDKEIIPLLLEPYMCLLRETESLRNLAVWRQNSVLRACDGCSAGHVLRISCIYFESMCLFALNMQCTLILCRNCLVNHLHMHLCCSSVVVSGSVPMCPNSSLTCGGPQYVGICG